MKNSDRKLERLLRSAADTARNDPPNEMPFGFDTRVLAAWRAGTNYDLLDVGRLLRRVVLLSLAVIVFATAGMVHELRQPEDTGDAFNQYAIADNAISDVVEP
jgi:signal transduction histidine kinase